MTNHFSKKKAANAIVIHAQPKDFTLLQIINVLEENNVKVKKVMIEKRDRSSDFEELLR
ncbi:hypothetical protein KHA80_09860 [Anaerobacillus sp. HL2]|nr:hypothetical protein KHA80_09860 [Anaerobacillus sp. HL2]